MLVHFLEIVFSGMSIKDGEDSLPASRNLPHGEASQGDHREAIRGSHGQQSGRLFRQNAGGLERNG